MKPKTRLVAFARSAALALVTVATAHAFTYDIDEVNGTFSYTDGTWTLEGIFAKPSSGSGPFPAVIINHGAGGSTTWSAQRAAVMKAWGAIGMVCIGPEMTHKAGGETDTALMGHCAENSARGVACYNILEALGYVDMTRVAIYGHSMGGYAGIGQAAELTALGKDLRIASLTSSGSLNNNPAPPSPATPTLAEATLNDTGWGMWVGSGDNGQVINSQNFYNILGNNSLPRYRLVIPGIGHNDVPTNATAVSEMQTWYQDHGQLAYGSPPTGLAASVVSSSQINLAWNTVAGASGYEVLRGDTAAGPFEVVYTGSTNSHNDTGLDAATQYYYYARATHSTGRLSEWSTAVTATTSGGTTILSCPAVAGQDGWVREDTEEGNTGGSISSTGVLQVGDSGSDQQIKAILAFNTSGIPDNATIVSATLQLRRSSVNVTNPFTTHGTCYADIHSTGFGGSTTLATGDFEAPATATQVATLSNPATNGALSTGTLNATGRSAINLTGTTQFRVYFSTGDNDDNGIDVVSFNSGNDMTQSFWPVLLVEYQ